MVDLENSVKKVKARPEMASQLAGVYGMVAAIPDKSIVDDFLVKLFGELFCQGPSDSILEESRKSSGQSASDRKSAAESRAMNRTSSM